MFFIRLRTDMICLTTLQPYALDTSATNTTPKNNSVFFFPPPMNIPIFTSPKTNIDTKNDGLEHVSPASHMASFWVAATFHFRASKSLVAHFGGDFSPRWRCVQLGGPKGSDLCQWSSDAGRKRFRWMFPRFFFSKDSIGIRNKQMPFLF